MAKEKTTSIVTFRNDGVYLVNSGGNSVRVADPILVTAFATSNQGTTREEAFIALKFRDRHRKWKREIVPSSMVAARKGEFVAVLSTRGYVWPSGQALRNDIIDALSLVKPKRNIRVTDVPGWLGKIFVLPKESYSPNGPDRKNLQIRYNPTVKLGEFRRSGELKLWMGDIAKSCIYSTRARLAVAAVFAAPNLRPLNIGSFGFNFSGPTSAGKTLLVRLASSAAGLNSSEGPATWDGSAPAFEQRALGHRDCMMPLDDLSHLEGDPTQVTKLAKLVTFRLAGNRPKAKAGQYVLANNLPDADFRLISLSTSEDPIWAKVGNAGHRHRVRGEEVRMINVRACISNKGDIFDGPNADRRIGAKLNERIRFVEEQEQLALTHQGKAFRRYLRKRVADTAADETLKKYMAEFINAAPLDEELRWLGRIRRLFAVVYASAALAIDYGVLPWGKKSTLKAICVCMTDAMDQLKATFDAGAGGASIKSDEALLAEFKHLITAATFVRLDKGRKKGSFVASLKTAHGILRPTKSAKREHLLFADTLQGWFPDITTRNRLVKLLRSRRIFGKGRRPDTSTRQVFIAELGGKVPCYALSRKRLRSGSAASKPSG